VLFIDDVRNGAVRTIFNGSIQPSELAKLMIVIYLSVWLFSKGEKINEFGFGLIPMGVILGVVGGLIVSQPDLSAVITILILGGIMFFIAGGELRQILIIAALAVAVGFLVVRFNLTGSDRIQSYTYGLQDPMQASLHVRRALEAFVNGGVFGVGIGNSETKVTGLPFPATDSVFAVVGEETGLVGSVVLVLLYTTLLWRGLIISQRAPDALGRMLAAGLSLWIALEAFINMAVMLNLMPFAGNALPLISSGGSNMLVTFTAIGILMNISRLSKETNEEGRLFSAVVDLRRRDWRRSVSRPRRGRGSAGD
jgi:cell division protein FtsW